MANEWQRKKHRFELLDATKSGDAAAVQAVIDAARASGWDRAAHSAATERDADGFNALMVASSCGFADIVRILAPISPVNAQAKNSLTALMMAASLGRADCVKELLPFAKAQMENVERDDALSCALAKGRLDCARLLLPASKAFGSDEERVKAFKSAALSRNADCLRLALPASDEALAALLETWSQAAFRKNWPEAFGVLEAEQLRREIRRASGAGETAEFNFPATRRAPRSL